MTLPQNSGRKSRSHVRHKGIGRKIALAVLILVVVGIVAVAVIQTRNSEDASGRMNRLQQQFHDAANGIPVPENVYGGAMVVKRSPDGNISVTASGVPAKACIHVGYTLSREGVVVVNGVLAPRVSSARLTEMCNSNDGANKDNNTLLWTPRPAE